MKTGITPGIDTLVEEISSLAQSKNDQTKNDQDKNKSRFSKPGTDLGVQIDDVEINHAKPSFTISQKERAKLSLFTDLVCRARLYIGENVVRITKETLEDSPLKKRHIQQTDEVIEKDEITESQIHEIEALLTVFKQLLEEALKYEAKEKEIKKMRVEAAQIQARNPEANPFIGL